MLSSLCSLSHFILTLRCVWWGLCMCVSDRLLCPLSPLPCGCAVLCSGSNDGFCASQSSSQQDTHIKGSFSGRPCRVSMCQFLRVCVCVFVHMCTSLCDSKHIIFRGACWLCLILCACPNHQGSLCVSASIFPSHSPPPFFHLSFPPLISPPNMKFLPSSDNFSELLLYLSAIEFYQGSLSYSLLQMEASTLQKTTIPLGETSYSTQPEHGL